MMRDFFLFFSFLGSFWGWLLVALLNWGFEFLVFFGSLIFSFFLVLDFFFLFLLYVIWGLAGLDWIGEGLGNFTISP
jgi:hypothetical protein